MQRTQHMLSVMKLLRVQNCNASDFAIQLKYLTGLHLVGIG